MAGKGGARWTIWTKRKTEEEGVEVGAAVDHKVDL